MSVTVANSRFIGSSIRRWAALYQHLRSNVSDFERIGKILVVESEQTHILRQGWWLEELSIALARSPLREYRMIGHYYQGWCARRRGEDARATFESVAEQSEAFRAKALISLAAVETGSGNHSEAIKYYREAIKRSANISTRVQAIRGAIIAEALDGNHALAVKHLEDLGPLAPFLSPFARYQYLNSLAVELGEVGRIEEAKNICKIVLASPYAFAYPEWRETSGEINLRGYKSRSAVSPKQRIAPNNLLHLPERIAPEPRAPKRFQQPGSVTRLEDWKRKMVKEPNGNDADQLPEDMTSQDMAMKLLELITENRYEEDKIREVLEHALEVFSRPDKPE
jgi:tetratricopeptide (TPR) repeat protein